MIIFYIGSILYWEIVFFLIRVFKIIDIRKNVGNFIIIPLSKIMIIIFSLGYIILPHIILGIERCEVQVNYVKVSTLLKLELINY